MATQRWYWWALVVVLLLAFGLRIWGLDFGLPARYHPDESKVVRVDIQALSGDWRPTEYKYPGFFKHIIAVVDVIWYWGLGLFGEETPRGLGGKYVSVLYYLARYLSASSGVLAVALMVPLTRRLFHQRAIMLLATLFTFRFIACLNRELPRLIISAQGVETAYPDTGYHDQESIYVVVPRD